MQGPEQQQQLQLHLQLHQQQQHASIHPKSQQQSQRMPRGAAIAPHQDDYLVLARTLAHAADAADAAGHVSGDLQVPDMPDVLVHHKMPSRPEHITAWPPRAGAVTQPGATDVAGVTGSGSNGGASPQSDSSGNFAPYGLFTWHNSCPGGVRPKPPSLLRSQPVSGIAAELDTAQGVSVHLSYGQIGGPQSGTIRDVPGSAPGLRLRLLEVTGSCKIEVKRRSSSGGKRKSPAPYTQEQQAAAAQGDVLCAVKVRVRRFYVIRDRPRAALGPALGYKAQQQQHAPHRFWLPYQGNSMLARVACNVFTGEVLEEEYYNTTPQELTLRPPTTDSSEPVTSLLTWSALAQLLASHHHHHQQQQQQQQQVVAGIPVVGPSHMRLDLMAGYHQQTAQLAAPAAVVVPPPLQMQPPPQHSTAAVLAPLALADQAAMPSMALADAAQGTWLQPRAPDALEDMWPSCPDDDFLAVLLRDAGTDALVTAAGSSADVPAAAILPAAPLGPTTTAAAAGCLPAANPAMVPAADTLAAPGGSTADTATEVAAGLQLVPAVAPQVVAAARAAAAAAQALADDDGLPGPSHSLLSWEDKAVSVHRQLRLELWRVYRGWYTEQAPQVLWQLCTQLQRFNLRVGPTAPVKIDILTEKDDFLDRNILHLAGSIVAEQFGGGVMSDDTRRQLMQATREAVGPWGFQKLLTDVNKNQAPPLFTCGHFAGKSLAALKFLLEEGVLSLEHLLACTKRYKMTHHIMSTMAAAASPQERGRYKEGLQLLLALMAELVAKRLVCKTPQQLKQKAARFGLQDIRQQQHQQELLGQVGIAAFGTAAAVAGSSNDIIGAAADKACDGHTQGVMKARIYKIAENQQQQQQQQVSTSSADWSGQSLWDEVVWWLQHYYVYHTAWQSQKSSSPPYNGVLLQEVVWELFSFEVKQHTAAAMGSGGADAIQAGAQKQLLPTVG